MRVSVRPWWMVVAGVPALLLITAFRFDTLPFIPGAAFTDAATSHWPAALLLRESVLSGEFPVWRDTFMAGAPFAANPLNKTAYPLQWLAVLLPPTLHLNGMIILHLAIAGFGMYRWVRSFGCHEGAAAFAALCYGVSPRLISATGAGHLDVIYAMAWLPWVILTATGFAHGGTLRQGVIASLAVSMLILSDLRIALFGLVVAAGVVSGHWWRVRQRVRWQVSLLSMLLTALLTISVTVPLALWWPYLSRAGLNPAEAGIFSLEPVQFVGLIFPQTGGSHETIVFFGLGVLLLALVAVAAQPKRVAGWVFLLIVSGWWALGSNGAVWSMAAQVVPALSFFRVPARAWVIAALIVPMLAGLGLHWLITFAGEQNRAQRRVRLMAAAALLVCLICLAAALTGPAALRTAALPLAAAAILCILLLIRMGGRIAVNPLIALATILAAAELLTFARGWLEWRGEDRWLLPYQRLAELLLEDNTDRVYSPAYSLPQEAAAAFDINLFGGVDPFQLRGVSAAILRGGGITFEGYSIAMPPLVDVSADDLSAANREAVPDTRVLADWGVSHVAAPFPIAADSLILFSQVDGQFLYRNTDYQEATRTGRFPSGYADLPDEVTIEAFNRVTVAVALVSALALVCAGIWVTVARQRE